MYDFLRGRVSSIAPMRIGIETSGIGWDVIVPLSTSRRIGPLGSEVKILTHLVVREDALLLYGFATEEERTLFRTLIGLNGIGPATALQVLSSTTPQDFAVAVEKQDADFLKRIKGIGPKTAKRIIVELKGAKTLLPPPARTSPQGIVADAVTALVVMGLTEREAIDRVERASAAAPAASLEELIKLALQRE